jgi:hypothetical protein
MDQQRTVAKLMLNIEEFGLDVRTALEQAYAAGYDERGMDLNNHKIRGVTMFARSGGKVRDFESIKQAAEMNKISRDTVSDNIIGRTKYTMNKQYYFKYTEK